jgi:glycosyltransferase involved in cell wall biosynthesis
MLRNLEWFQQLDIQYDSSTFDTDPFEPQPDGSRTIFPFWVAGASDASVPQEHRRGDGRNGYVELPYTLPQDSTLFLLLEERTTAVWRRKLAWLVERRGMAMVNVHPDYLRFEGDSEKRSTYPAELYASFLREVAGNYAGRYWPALPRQVADWYAANAPRVAAPADPKPLAGKRAAVLLYSNYPSDPRPRRAAEALVEAGMAVDLLCLSQADDDPKEEVVKGVRVFRHPMRRRRDGVSTYIWQYARFVLAAFWFLSRRGWRKKYDVVHVHNMPDFLAFAAVGAKVRGARLVLDLHDPSPELMMTIFGLPARHWFVRTLRLVERLSIGLSDIVLTPNITFKDLFVSRSCRADKVEIVMNSPDPAIFSRAQGPVEMANPGESSEFRVMHHGLIAHRHGVDLLVEAVALLHRQIPSIRLDIFGGETPFLAVVLQRASELGIGPIVRYHGSKSQAEIAAAIQRCHVGIVPNRRSVFTEINFPTRLFEYLALGRPVVAPCTQGIRDYFAADEMVMFEPGDVAALAQRIRFIHDEPEQALQYVAKGSAVYARYQWPGQKRHFVGLIEKLLGPGRAKSAGALPERGGVAP